MTDEDLLESFIVDFQAQNMFITRAIKLANKEEKFALAAGVVELTATIFKLFATWQVTWVKALLIFMTKMKIMIISFYETVGFS